MSRRPRSSTCTRALFCPRKSCGDFRERLRASKLASMSDDMKARAREMVAETPKLPEIDVRERAGDHSGNPQVLEKRLFMQLLVYQVDESVDADQTLAELGRAFDAAQCAGVIYRDANDPRGLGVLS